MCLPPPERISEITNIENPRIAPVDVGSCTRGVWPRHASEANIEDSCIDQASVAIRLLSNADARGAQSVGEETAAPKQSAHSSDCKGAARDQLQQAAARC
jgi:hypothetical protein